MLKRIVCTLYTADHSSLRMSRQMLPDMSMLGWYIGVIKMTCGGVYGYVGGKVNDNLNDRSVYG